ncbi:ferredoxin [Actinoplanes sp. TFC3]|uniref:ferredoxin n=1 Tax=Actinoplanes sp. TFC3 TaxID=1710355 RepID=UPI0008378267|nr:ferredoxin [Actinoplanes sp. TFC3]
MRLEVDTGRCVGAAQCSRAEPEVFDQDDDEGTVLLLLSEPPARLQAGVRTAADLCPVRAITIVAAGPGFESASSGPDHHPSSDSCVHR